MVTYLESIPYLIIITLTVCLYIGKGVKIKSHALDILVARIGVAFGIFMTFMNLKYASGELLLLSPLISITSVLYLRFRDEIAINEVKLVRSVNFSTLKKINILFWILILSAVVCNRLVANDYQRPLTFFIICATCIALVGVEIICTNIKSNSLVGYIIIKILVITLLLSSSSYFLSPYPLGSDPWAHAEYIKNFIHYGKLEIRPGMEIVDAYYLVYPLFHLFCTITTLILDITIKDSMYIIGLVLALSSIFTYLLAKKITKNINIALLSMLLLSVSGSHIQWSIQIIAMSYGIAIYSILLYIFLTKKEDPIYETLAVLFLIIIIWTHTISSFILIVSITTLTLSSILIDTLQNKRLSTSNLNLIILAIVILIYHWTDIKYLFLQKVLSGLINSYLSEVNFLGTTGVSNIVETYSSLYKYGGNLSYMFFGIIGTLYFLGKRETLTREIPLISMIVILYAFRYVFPIFGMRNIIPDRWPAFIMVSFTIFIAVGFYKCIQLISKNKKKRIGIILILLFSLSFLMITDAGSDPDSPVYGGNTYQRLMWTESEMYLFQDINNIYKGTIVADEQTSVRPFSTYLQRDFKYIKYYETDKEGKINWDEMNGCLIIWRKISLNRPITVSQKKDAITDIDILLGDSFKENMDSKFCCVYDVGEAKAYL